MSCVGMWTINVISTKVNLTIKYSNVYTQCTIVNYCTHLLHSQMYVAEMSPPKKRGFLGTFHLILKMIGISMSYLMGAIPGLLYTHSALFMVVVLLFSELLMILLKESPRWLLIKNYKYAAKKSLFWLFRSQKTVEKLVELIEASLSQTSIALKDKLKMFRERHVYIPLILSVGISFFHQFTGSNAIISYAAQIFLTAEVENAEETAIYAVGLLQLVGVIVSALVIDLAGRKKLLIFGSIGIAISNTVLGTHLYITRASQCGFTQNESNLTVANQSYSGDGSEHCYSSLGGLAITSVISFSFFYAVGWRSLPYIMMGEMYPNSVRGILGGIGAMVLFTFVSVVVGGYPAYEEAVHPYTAWWSFAGVAALSIPFIIILPETKGKSLEQIEEYFKRKKKSKQEDSAQLVGRHDSIVSTLTNASGERRESILSKETSV